MKEKRSVRLGISGDFFIEIPLDVEGDHEVSTIMIDGVLYHFERIKNCLNTVSTMTLTIIRRLMRTGIVTVNKEEDMDC